MNTSIIQSMIRAIDKPAIFITPDYIIQAVNQAYKDTYDTSVTLGQSRCYEISHKNTQPCDQSGEDCPIQQCKKNNRTTNVVHIHESNGSKTYCDILMKPVIDESGITLGFLEIIDKINYASSEVQSNKMIGSSKPFKNMLNLINRSANSNINILLQGETGTGKELIAQAVHEASNRKDKPFVIIECTGLNESLFESELFGHEKGAFTGATSAKKGLIEIGHGGTIFFDEIGDIPLNMQVKLLRLIETRSFRAVGGLMPKSSDFRLICASHKNLFAMVQKGEFREDLYYRIANFPIDLPPLRERKEDIKLLIKQFLKDSDFKNKKLSKAALEKLYAYDYPGNIRELKSKIEQAVLISNDDIIDVDDLPTLMNKNVKTNNITKVITLEAAEQQYIKSVCETFEGSLEEFADALDISSRTLYRKLQKYNLKFIPN